MARNIVFFLWGMTLAASICLGIFVAPGFFLFTFFAAFPILILSIFLITEHWDD